MRTGLAAISLAVAAAACSAPRRSPPTDDRGAPVPASTPPASTALAPAAWTERPLTTSDDLRYVNLSPDGAQLALLGKRALTVVTFDPPSERVVLSALPDGTAGLSWSPDGRRIALEVAPAGGYGSTSYTIFDAVTGAVVAEVPQGSGGGQLIGPETLMYGRSRGHASVGGRGCDLPGPFQAVSQIIATTDAIYVALSYADDTTALFVTDADCAKFRYVVPATPVSWFYPAAGRMFAVAEAEPTRLLAVGPGGALSIALELPPDTHLHAVRPDGGLVLSRLAWGGQKIVTNELFLYAP